VSVVGVGIDAVDVDRFAGLLRRRALLGERLFTDRERADAAGSAPRLAARFAAKEAVMKALGVGVGAFRFHEVEVVRAASGQPSLLVTGVAADLAEQRGVTAWHVSLTHTATVAEAVVIGESAP
jgi:holo-[acyl-carrier protein] synthase